jgi:hypothetical protein
MDSSQPRWNQRSWGLSFLGLSNINVGSSPVQNIYVCASLSLSLCSFLEGLLLNAESCSVSVPVARLHSRMKFLKGRRRKENIDF